MMLNIFSCNKNIKVFGNIHKRGERYRYKQGKNNIIYKSFLTLKEAEQFREEQKRKIQKKEIEYHIELIKSSNFSKKWKNKSINSAKKVYQLDLLNIIDKDMLQQLVKVYGDARKRKFETHTNRKRKDFSITFYFFLIKYWETKGKCPISNKTFNLKKIDDKRLEAPSIDRIFNDKGYTQDNIQVMSWRCNRMKFDLSFNEIKNISKGWINYIDKIT